MVRFIAAGAFALIATPARGTVQRVAGNRAAIARMLRIC